MLDLFEELVALIDALEKRQIDYAAHPMTFHDGPTSSIGSRRSIPMAATY